MAEIELLITNDDGICAEGLAALKAAAEGLGRLVIVAPDECHSGGGHRVTTRDPIRLCRRDEVCYSVAGTPADCVRLALDRLAPAVTWVLSGINHGGNLGADVYMSGTVAAVREGVLHGRPGIAVSHYHRRGAPFDWPRAARWTAPVLRDLMGRSCPPGTFWNVNLPHPEAKSADPEVVFCPLDTSPLPVSYSAEGETLLYNGDYHSRARQPGSDVDVCFAGKIAVSLVKVF